MHYVLLVTSLVREVVAGEVWCIGLERRKLLLAAACILLFSLAGFASASEPSPVLEQQGQQHSHGFVFDAIPGEDVQLPLAVQLVDLCKVRLTLKTESRSKQ
jgi:hypothetical protein